MTRKRRRGRQAARRANIRSDAGALVYDPSKTPYQVLVLVYIFNDISM